MVSLQVYFELSHELLCTSSSDGLLLDVNPAWTRTLGWSRSEVKNSPLTKFSHPDDRLLMDEQLRLLQASGGVQSFENRFLHKDGSFVWLTWTLTRDDDNGTIIAGARDNSEARRQALMWQQAQDVIGLGTWEIDLFTKKLSWSRVTHLIHETDPATFRPSVEDAIQFYHPDSRPTLTKAVDNLLREGQPYHLTLRFITAKGRERWVEAHARAELHQGHVVRAYGTFQDVTERVQEEFNLRRFKKVVEFAREGIWEIDGEGRTIYANSRMAEMLETTVDEMQGTNFLSYMDPDQAQSAVVKMQSRKQGQDEIHEFQFKTKSGRPLWAMVSSKSLTDAQGQMSSAVAMITDISKLKEESYRLTVEKGRYENLVNALNRSAIVAVTDRAGRITFANELLCKLSGYSQQELIGQNHRIISSGQHSKEFFAEMWKTISSGKVWHGEICNRKKNGELYWVDSTILPLESAEASGQGYIALRFEITDRKKMERDLIAAKEREEKANSAKTQFFTTMSHEIRSPLNGVLGMSDILAESELNQSQKECIAAIKYSAESLLGIINDVLDFSKIDAGRLELEQIDFDFYRMVEELTQTFRVVNGSKPIELILEAPTSGEQVHYGDPIRVRQILSNLIGNAIKFTRQGKIWVRVKELSQNDARSHLRIEVEDQGVGIPSEVQALLFQPFSQADTATTRQFGGTGLGLSICKKLIELMGGTIGVNSVPGQGSTFWFELSIRFKQQARELVAPAVEVVRKNYPHKVLVVDDNEINRKVAHSLLGRFGLEITVVESGLLAIEAVQKQSYEIVFMDCQMPELDGYETTGRIRRLPLPKQPIIIAMTANALTSDRDRCLGAGMDDFLTKPLRNQALEQMLQCWLDGPRPVRAVS